MRNGILFKYCFVAGRRRMSGERIAKQLSERALTDAGDHANIHANVRHKLYYKKVLVTLIVQISLFGTKKTF